MILGADIGGTHTRICLAEPGGSPRHPLVERRYRSREHASFEDILRRFLREGGHRLSAAAIGVAGPVLDGRAEPTNLPWSLDRSSVSSVLGTDAVAVLNDLVTTGLGLPWLEPRQFAIVNRGEEHPEGNAALIAAGTGLGKSILVRRGGRFDPIPSEGGHAEFAPRDEEMDELVRYLRVRLGFVTAEHVVSGPGLVRLYEFVASRDGANESPEVRRRLSTEDGPRVVSELGLSGEDPLCARALGLFVRAYATEASNLAATALATGGLFVGGGIAPKILPALADGLFAKTFVRNPSLKRLLQRIPIRVVLEEDTSLIGATALAMELAGRTASGRS